MADTPSVKTAGVTGLVPGQQGNMNSSQPGVVLQEFSGVQLIQLAVFPEQMKAFETSFKRSTGAGDLPGLSASHHDEAGLVVRPELTKFWLIRPQAAGPFALAALARYFPLDFSGSRVLLKLSGRDAQTLINRFCAVNLSCESGRFLATGIHHVPVHILKRAETDYVLFLPRSFAESLSETLHHTALQFGVEVRRPASWRKSG